MTGKAGSRALRSASEVPDGLPGDALSAPVTARPLPAWGSDIIAEQLSQLGLRFLSLTPGSSFRGLQDSIVNYLGNSEPRILLSLNEESAVAIAHGYAKVTEQPMAVALHSNVGLMHAAMAVYNAWCDRVPMVIVGATGPVDASERRPWIDWIHTVADQGALVRPYVKWDDEPASVQAAVDSLARANLITRTYPRAPVYVNLDVGIQEMALDNAVVMPAMERSRPPGPSAPRASDIEQVASVLRGATRPLILLGRVSREDSAWNARVELAERLGALVLPDLKVAAGFPSDHPLNPASPGTFLTESGRGLLRAADVIVALDVVDLAGTLQQAYGEEPVDATVISCSQDFVLHNGWTKDHFALAPVDVPIAVHPDTFVTALLDALSDVRHAEMHAEWLRVVRAMPSPSLAGGNGDEIAMGEVAEALRAAVDDLTTCLVRIPLGWEGQDVKIDGPLDYLGSDGGGGLGSGPGMTVGAALALWRTGRLAVSVLGDGDFLMGVQALWTAAHYKLPMLVVVANNRSFLNDEIHQERVAVQRGRSRANRWVGQRLENPAPDIASLAQALGLRVHGPVTDRAGLGDVLAAAASEAAAGAAVVVDVHVTQETYSVGAVGR